MRQGKKVQFANGTLTLSPLTLLQLQELEEDLKELRAMNRETVLSTESNLRLVRVLAAAARRAHPDITPEAVLGMIDMEDVIGGAVNEAIRLLMGSSGLTPRAEEANGAGPPGPRIGGGSTLDSPPH